MLKAVHSKVFSFDVEWTPDPMAAEIITGVEHDAPNSLPAAFRSLWDYGGADEQIPQPYLKTILCRVVSIAGILREKSPVGTELKLISLPSDPADPEKAQERRILQAFFKAVGRAKPQIVGYNSANADVPILVQRAIVNGISGMGFGQRPDKPWEGADYFAQGGDYHLDLAPMLGKFKQTPSLHEAATLCGIPGKVDVSGDSVAEMWLQGRLKEIVDYNEFDAFTTHLLWARMARFADLLSQQEYEHEHKLVRDLLEGEIASGRGHLERFVAEWDRLQAIVQRF